MYHQPCGLIQAMTPGEDFQHGHLTTLPLHELKPRRCGDDEVHEFRVVQQCFLQQKSTFARTVMPERWGGRMSDACDFPSHWWDEAHDVRRSLVEVGSEEE